MWKAARETLDPIEGPLEPVMADAAAIATRYEVAREGAGLLAKPPFVEPGNRAGALSAIAELAIAGGSPSLMNVLRWWYIAYHRERLWRSCIYKVGPVGGPFQLVALLHSADEVPA